MRARACRSLVAIATCLIGLAAGRAEAEIAGLAAELEGVRGRAGAMRSVQLAQADDPGRLARFEVRLAQLEEELRRLTGRIEQLEFGQRALTGRIDQLVEDLDQRLLALEGADGDAAEDASAEDRTQRQALAPSSEQRPSEAAAGDDTTLCIVPESALRDLPRPEPGSIAPPPQTANLPPQAQYDAAMQLLRAGDYPGAEGGLQLFLDINPDHALAPNAAYWLAETHYVRKNYAAAAAAFARNYRVYGTDDAKAPDNLLKLGMSLQGLQETDKACRTFTELATAFPNAPAHIQQALSRERERAGCA
jgi:tol-pal system protein YbgF